LRFVGLVLQFLLAQLAHGYRFLGRCGKEIIAFIALFAHILDDEQPTAEDAPFFHVLYLLLQA
jgi:hypothetical protein